MWFFDALQASGDLGSRVATFVATSLWSWKKRLYFRVLEAYYASKMR